MTDPLQKILVDVLTKYDDWRSNAGCNDWFIPNTPENWAFVNHVFLYGIAKRLWDGGCPPTIQKDGTIGWFDTSVASYIVKALQCGDLKLDMRVSV